MALQHQQQANTTLRGLEFVRFGNDPNREQIGLPSTNDRARTTEHERQNTSDRAPAFFSTIVP